MPLKIFQGHSRSVILLQTESPYNVIQFNNMNLGIYPTIYQIEQIVIQIFAVRIGGTSNKHAILEKPRNRQLPTFAWRS